MKIPNFSEENNYWDFVPFIQKHTDIFDKLLLSGRFRLTRGFDEELILEAYDFAKNTEVDDDGNRAILYEDQDDMNEFVRWLNAPKTQEYFDKVMKEHTKKKRQDAKRRLTQKREEKERKRRTMKRTSMIKSELLEIDLVPDVNEHSVKGKTFREAKKRFDIQKIGNQG